MPGPRQGTNFGLIVVGKASVIIHMLPILIRGIVVYIIIIASVRLMGKRQIGELQPFELVITILLSDIASMPLQNSNTPLLQSVVSVFLLISLEIITSCLALKFRPFRTLLQGHSVMIVKEGKIDRKSLEKIRYSVDDVVEALRMKDVFDIEKVNYAYVETNGSLSVLLKDGEDEPKHLPCLVISDGKIVDREFDICGLSKEKLLRLLEKNGLRPSDVLMMTYSADKKAQIVLKKEDKN